MTAFLLSLAVLIGGYLIYGALVDRLLATDSARQMPAYTMRDDIDYRPLAPWRVFLIQFLNIAGLGPIFGAIMALCSALPLFCGSPSEQSWPGESTTSAPV